MVFARYETIVRDRVLKPNEIIELRDIFAASQREYETAEDRRSAARPLQRETQLALWIRLGTACRIGELLKARWEPLKNRRNDNSLVLSRGESGEWTPHDLHRTAATMMQALGVSLDVIDRCQNRVLPGSKVRRHYMHHDYAEEKREAWWRLGSRIDSILATS